MNKGRAGFTKHVLVLAGFLSAFMAFLIFALAQAGFLPRIGDKYIVTAEVPTANFLGAGARVTVAGAPVGDVKSVTREGPQSPNTIVKLQLTNPDVYPLPNDSHVEIRTRSQVGENYVNIVVGKSKDTIANNGSIGLNHADQFVSVDQILSVLQGKTKERARTLLTSTGDALQDRGSDLHATLSSAAGVINYGTQTVSTLDPDRLVLGRLVDELGSVTRALGDRQQAITTIAHQGTASLQAIGNRDRYLAETLHELPATLDSIKSASAVLGSVSDRAAPVVSNLAAATRQLQPAVEALAPAARDGRAVLARVDDTIPELTHFLTAFPTITGYPFTNGKPGGLQSVTSPLRAVTCQLNPALRYLKPRTDDFFRVVDHLGSGANSYDATGHLVRLTPILNENSLSGAPPEVQDAARKLLSSGAFLPQKTLALDAYPETGFVGNEAAKPGDPQTVAEYAKTYKYPHITADC